MIVRLFYICSIFAAFVCGQVTFIRLRPVTFLPVSFGLAQECRLSSATGGSAVSAGECKPLPECLLVYTQLIELQRRPCRLQNGLFGVCCPTDSANVTSGLSTAGTLVFRPPSNVVIPDLKLRDFQNAFQSAREAVRRRTQLESQLFQDRVVVRPGTPVGLHLELFPTTQQTLDIGAGALSNLETSIQLVNQNRLSADQGRFALPTFQTAKVVQLQETCPAKVSCTEDDDQTTRRFRTADGSCNNRAHGDWGKADTTLQRIIPAKYADGVNKPRLSVSGLPLPSARLVSQSLTGSGNSRTQSPLWTLMLMQWGQFIDHDITHSPLVRGENASGITCCQDGNVIEESRKHPDCMPIVIDGSDLFFGRFGQTCMEFVRSLPAVRPQCTFGPREQLNQVTGFLDGSAVYGSSKSTAKDLRELSGGRLRQQLLRNNNRLLPIRTDDSPCSDSDKQQFCFKAGDGRVNEQPQLAAMHTIWMREHNRIADRLHEINPSWDDERLYQESRRIVIAEIQHITFNEFLPIFLGEKYMAMFQLSPLAIGAGFTSLYDPHINPSVTNEFATAAFRVGHSLIQGVMEGFSPFGAQTRNLPLHQHQFRPFELYENNGMNSLVRGLLMQPAQQMDHLFSDEVRNRLFQGNSPFGMDLIALNIQRGRDHGLPPYNDYRELCGKTKARRWQDLVDIIEPNLVEEMKRVYDDVDDIDLFIGAVSEKLVDGALLGPTFLCIIGDQMSRLRRGDAYFYEEGNRPSSFTLDQLNSLRHVTLSRVLCDNTDDANAIQPKAFLRSSLMNKRMPCESSEMASVDLNLWRQV